MISTIFVLLISYHSTVFAFSSSGLAYCSPSTQTIRSNSNNGQRIQSKSSFALNLSSETGSKDDGELASNPSRRQMLAQSAVAAFSSLVIPTTAVMADENNNDSSSYPYNTQVSFGASWSAVDGLNEMDLSNRNDKVVGFDMKSYKAMRDDPTRTPVFEKAIKERLFKTKNPESQVVLDLGTGPFALFAMMAADMGAGKVYAIEGNPEAAASARYTVKKAGYEDIITVIEGLSTQIQLPEKVDFCVAELIGSVGSEEGVYATVKDAARFLKEPTDSDNWIPTRIQTYGAPASYTLHNLFGPPEFDWTKLGGEPVRFRCSDNGLQLLSDPQVIEDVSFAVGAADRSKEEGTLTFSISADRITKNVQPLFEEFKQKSDAKSSQQYAETTSRSLSGIAMWPRLFLNDHLIIDSRNYPLGGHQKSHWQTVLPIMSGRPLGSLKGGETVEVKYKFELPSDVTKPPQYSIQGVLKYNS
ncbi:unnamed protein product [Cylindrotheca closterium]|uniref:PRMT5 arginine-N-methyltransferase domain-containing protein n=1 Tax=Cylindrotheca closterium TaxID=2856 RepID=A0AAD2PX80_9STRA|nr:unnamed protein product [Cylindrotheca closterium]